MRLRLPERPLRLGVLGCGIVRSLAPYAGPWSQPLPVSSPPRSIRRAPLIRLAVVGGLLGVGVWQGPALWDVYQDLVGTAKIASTAPGQGADNGDALADAAGVLDDIDNPNAPRCQTRLITAPPGFTTVDGRASGHAHLRGQPGAVADCSVTFRHVDDVKSMAATLTQFDTPARALADHRAELALAVQRGLQQVATPVPGTVAFRGQLENGIHVVRIHYVKGARRGYVGIASNRALGEADVRTVAVATRAQLARV